MKTFGINTFRVDFASAQRAIDRLTTRMAEVFVAEDEEWREDALERYKRLDCVYLKTLRSVVKELKEQKP